MRGLVIFALAALAQAQRYLPYRPLIAAEPLYSSEKPRLQEPKPIQLSLYASPSLLPLLEKAEMATSAQTIPGYRIQVLSTPEKVIVDSARFFLIETYPELPVYISYEVPTYRVRVGDFLSKAEASSWLEILRRHFREAFIMPDQIYKP